MRTRLSFWLGVLIALFITHAGQAAVPAQHFTMDNGLVVVLVESHANPMSHVRILFPGGSYHDPKGKEGVASLAAWMANEGAGNRDATAFQAVMDFHGIHLNGDSSRDHFGVEMTTLTEHEQTAWQLFADAVLTPRFDQDIFQRAAEERLASLKRNQEDPEHFASRIFMENLYKDHLHARPTKGSLDSVPTIKVNDLKKFREDVVRAPGAVLVVAGDMTLNRLKGLVETHLNALSNKPTPLRPPSKKSWGEPGIAAHKEMDVSQTTVQMGFVGIERQDPDYFTVILLDHLLGGGGFGSRLNEEIREKKGLVYSVYSYYAPWPGRGPWIIWLQTKNESVQEAVDTVKTQLKDLAENGPSEKEITDAKLHLVGSFPLRLRGLSTLASVWASVAFYRRGWDYLDTWTERVEAVTRDDLQRVAKRFFKLDQLHVVTVGKSERKE
ncbi:MAG: insulinase family protein [Magnetococcales bacterium]|nr:insulinase family protein [Magnetococcales bacterium]